MKEIKTIENKPENKHPSNIEAEQALLGSILVNNDIIDEISNIVDSTIFYDPAHIKIFEVIPPGAAAIIITPSAISGVVPKNFININATIGKIIN